jgi:hypothetical protein
MANVGKPVRKNGNVFGWRLGLILQSGLEVAGSDTIDDSDKQTEGK